MLTFTGWRGGFSQADKDALARSLDTIRTAMVQPVGATPDAKLRARMGSIDAGVRPRLSLFAQGYYGYPGLNTFEDMMEHRWTLNGIVGVRLSWNIGNFYTRRNDKNRLATCMY